MLVIKKFFNMLPSAAVYAQRTPESNMRVTVLQNVFLGLFLQRTTVKCNLINRVPIKIKEKYDYIKGTITHP